MPSTRTRPLPGSVLIAVPAVTWATLIIVVWVYAALDQDAPFGGFWSLGIALAVTSTLASLGVWAVDSAKAHVSAEFAATFGMLSRRFDALDGLRDTVVLPRVEPQLYVASSASAGAVQASSPSTDSDAAAHASVVLAETGAARPDDLEGYLAETAEIYNLGYEAGKADRDGLDESTC